MMFTDNHKNSPEGAYGPAFSFAKYSLFCGIIGLVLLFFTFPSGMYLCFFLGCTGLACSLASKRQSGRFGIGGTLVSVFAVFLSLIFFLSFLAFYEMLRDPQLGPQISEMFSELMEQSGVPVSFFSDMMSH